jgi:hypothetical protein
MIGKEGIPSGDKLRFRETKGAYYREKVKYLGYKWITEPC